MRLDAPYVPCACPPSPCLCSTLNLALPHSHLHLITACPISLPPTIHHLPIPQCASVGPLGLAEPAMCAIPSSLARSPTPSTPSSHPPDSRRQHPPRRRAAAQSPRRWGGRSRRRGGRPRRGWRPGRRPGDGPRGGRGRAAVGRRRRLRGRGAGGYETRGAWRGGCLFF